MIVKGTKQLGSFRRGINLYIPKKVQSTPEQIIWKVAIFNGSPRPGEYIWDGTTLENGKPLYFGPVDAESGNPYTIQWSADENLWYLIDEGEQLDSAQSLDSWQNFSSALSYSQSSFISSITFYDCGDGDMIDYPMTRTSGGNTSFINLDANIAISYSSGDGYWTAQGIETINGRYTSIDLFNWIAEELPPAPTSIVISYSA
jgi:hypothetical protein